MVIDPKAELNKQYLSLSDRLNQLDQYTSQVNPAVIAGMTDFSNRPVGYNPLQDIGAAINFSENSRNIRSGVQGQQTALLEALMRIAEAEKDRSLQERRLKLDEAGGDSFVTDLKKEAAKADIKAGKLKLNPETGDLEYASPEELSEEKKGIVKVVDQLLGKNTKPITGVSQIEAMIPGTNAQKTVNLFNQLVSMLSLENRQKLKGSGQISDYESKVLEKAASSLTRSLSDDDFRATLEEMKQELSGKKTSGKVDKKADPLGIL